MAQKSQHSNSIADITQESFIPMTVCHIAELASCMST